MEELVGKGDVFEFSTLGLTREQVHGIYKSENKAKSAANKVIKERDLKLKETYKKGQAKLKTMEASINEIKKEIEGKMSEATSNPDMRESLTAESNSLMEKLSMLEAQVEKLREVLEAEGMRFEKVHGKKKKKTEKKDDKEDE
jgi:chromosome segregation ATPase